MVGIVTLLGPPGSGKGTQAARLSEGLGCAVLSTGRLLREARDAESKLGHSAAGYMDRGELVPDELVLAAIEDALEKLGDRPILLDGFPRTVTQARALDRALGGNARRLEAAILIDIPDDEVVRRIVNRRDGRSDDTAETARQRLRVYHHQTEPLTAYYAERGLLHHIDGARDADSVEDEIRAALA